MTNQSDAMGRVRVSERRFHVSSIIILVLALGALCGYIGYLAQTSINEVKKDNNDKLIQIEKKIDDSDAANKRFYCSMVIQFLHSDQTVDDCVTTNRIAEKCCSAPSTAATSTTNRQSPQSVAPFTPSASQPIPSNTTKDTSGEPSAAPPTPKDPGLIPDNIPILGRL